MCTLEEGLIHAQKIAHVLLYDSSMDIFEEGLIQAPKVVHVLS